MKRIVKKKKKNNLGFSLLEVLLAVVLLAIIVTPLIQTVYTSMSLNKKSRILMGATDVGQSAVEFFESLTYDDIKTLLENDGATVNIPAINYTAKAEDEGGGSWYGQNTDATTEAEWAERKKNWTAFAELAAYTNAFAGLNDKYIAFKSSDNFDFYAINKVTSNGFDYDLVVFIKPLFEGTEYSVYEVQVDVYYDNYKDPTYIHAGHDKKDFQASFKGSVFNKLD